MRLTHVTLTGADDDVTIDDLNAIAHRYPFAEFALLFMPEQIGTPRCPSISWINDFREYYQGKHTAMHLCGEGFIGFTEERDDILETMKGFDRIQLNLEFGAVEGRYDPDAMIAQIKANPAHEFIIQYTADKSALLPTLADIPSHALLFDGSAGQGITPDAWPQPIDGHKCGYAGGINPDNIGTVLKAIDATVTSGYETWIDMETGVRTNDRFDLDKVREVLQSVKDTGYLQES